MDLFSRPMKCELCGQDKRNPFGWPYATDECFTMIKWADKLLEDKSITKEDLDDAVKCYAEVISSLSYSLSAIALNPPKIGVFEMNPPPGEKED